jgi:hypothetical protein
MDIKNLSQPQGNNGPKSQPQNTNGYPPELVMHPRQ